MIYFSSLLFLGGKWDSHVNSRLANQREQNIHSQQLEQPLTTNFFIMIATRIQYY